MQRGIEIPVAIYYALQAEAAAEGVTSAGWASFLSRGGFGLSVDGTWPVRTEATNALKAE